MTDSAAGASPATTTGASPDDVLGDGGKRALQAEREARKEAEKRIRELEGKVQEFETAEVRQKVASAKGLTPEQARWLQGKGSTEEELSKAADDLLGAFGKQETGGPRSTPKEDLTSGATSRPASAAEDNSASKIADEILGGSRI